MKPRVANAFLRGAARRDARWALQSQDDARCRHGGVTGAGGAGPPPARPCRRRGEPAGPAAAAPCPPATAAPPPPACSALRCPPLAEVTALRPPAFPQRARRGRALRPAALRGAPAPPLPLSRCDSGGTRRPFPFFSLLLAVCWCHPRRARRGKGSVTWCEVSGNLLSLWGNVMRE